MIASALCLQSAVSARAAMSFETGPSSLTDGGEHSRQAEQKPGSTRSSAGAKKRRKGKRTVEAGVRVFTIKAETAATDEDRASAEETPRLNVRLVWGTMAEASDQSGFEAIEARLAKKLHKVFPWTSYYKILDKNLTTPENKNVTETLSPKARLQVRNLGQARFRLRLFGEGNRVINKTLTVDVDDIVALAGYDEHKMGWFVILKRATADAEGAWRE
jgi:hypothetical protein